MDNQSNISKHSSDSNKHPLVSVCVPTYNQEKEIIDALEGILNQDYDNLEIIIANDCSTDNTDAVIHRYLDKYNNIKYIRQEQNKGIIGNTKDCVMAATGRYVAICEGDDYWINNEKISKQVAILESDPNISMVHTNWMNLIEEENILEEHVNKDNQQYKVESKGGKEAFFEVLTNSYKGIRFSSILFRHNIFRRIITNHPNFFDSRFSTLDIGFFYALAYYGRFAYIPEYTTVYRFHKGSVSNSRSIYKSINYEIGVLISKCYFCQEFGIDIDLLSSSHKTCISGICSSIFFNNLSDCSRKLKDIHREYGLKLTWRQRFLLSGVGNNLIRILVSVILKYYKK